MDDGLAAESTVANLFDDLSRVVQFNRGADSRSDRAIREHICNPPQPLRCAKVSAPVPNWIRLCSTLYPRGAPSRERPVSGYENF